MAQFRVLLLAMAVCPTVQSTQFETTVTPLQGEDIASDCHYALTIPDNNHTIRATWVIFDRGSDVHALYSDPAVVEFARRFNIALLLHGHCPGSRPEDRNDMNMLPSDGLGPALVRALDQFARQAGHTELSTSKLIFLGFSGAGALCARLVAFLSDRALAAILSSPGHFEPVGIDTVKLNRRVLSVPELIIAGGADSVSGTARPFEYFREYREQGAPWAFVVQNRSPHCCTANVKELILIWLEEVMKQRQPRARNAQLRPMDQSGGWLAEFNKQETDITDSFRLRTFNITHAAIHPATRGQSPTDAGWLPNRSTAQLWLAFVTQREHPILPLN